MKPIKRVLRPERLRRVPAQFSWVDQRLVREGFVDRCDARAAALYLFLVTVADAQGLSYYSEAALTRRLRLAAAELSAARHQLIELELLAYQAPIYQVLALPSAAVATPPAPPASTGVCDRQTARAHLARLLAQLERRRDRL
ncbi:MAG: hypothetical protein HYU75_15425 [Betaproteobacteria bacterium]|nr:hypothetical protein [Betaproteobacteria bacterium]